MAGLVPLDPTFHPFDPSAQRPDLVPNLPEALVHAVPDRIDTGVLANLEGQYP